MSEEGSSFRLKVLVSVFLSFILFAFPCLAFSPILKNIQLNSPGEGVSFFYSDHMVFPHPTVIEVTITAYSSRPEETDDTPFITASGKMVREGYVAANFLPLGTAIKIPALFGDKVFYVEDRMNPKFKKRIDVWFPDYWEAKKFGVKRAKVLVLNPL